MIPVINAEGVVTEVYGRKVLDKRLRKGTPQHLYLPGAHQGVWNATALVDSEEVILCEALLDAMTFWVNGYRNVTASYGTSSFTDDHTLALKQANIKRVLIAYDRDEAGNTAAVKLAEQLQAEGFACYRLNFPKGMDANAYALEVMPANKSLGVVIRSAQWMGGGEAPERDPDPATISPLAAESQLQTETTESAPIAPELESAAPETESPPLPAAAVPPIADGRKVTVLREVLANESIGILIQAAFPGSIRMCKVKFGFELGRYIFVVSKLFPII